uniref:Uncharacterized protein n=1 Tax=Avena sativa TaxID=4498 RepID=A0ACD5ZL83_AVESA
MYSDRPRRSQRNRRGRPQQSDSSPVDEEDSSKASSNEPGPTISDASKFKTLTLNVSPPALDLTDRTVVHAGDMGTGLPDSTIMTSPPAEEALSPRSEERSEADWPLNSPRFDSVDDAFEYFFKSEQIAQAARDKAQTLSQKASLEKYEAQQRLLRDQAQPVLAEESSAVAAQGRYEGSKGKIAENGDKWMSEEVWEAFKKYLKKENLKERDYEFDELKKQCFHVEDYCKIFHHFNFTVKMKQPGSSDCYACKNQRMDDLKHPMIGAFDRGNPDTVFFMYGDDSSSDDEDGPVYDEAWRTRMRAAGISVG